MRNAKKMKYNLLTVFLTLTICDVYSQVAAVNKNHDDFYFEKSINPWNDKSMIWTINADYATVRLAYFRGDCCGGVPAAEQITAVIDKDTLYYNVNIRREPNCRTEIGLCGSAVDFVINIKKYPNYNRLVLKDTRNL